MLPKPSVYVVDDDPAVRSSFKWLMESVDLDIQAYSSAKAFLENYDPGRPGCLVLDVRMPEMSGLELQDLMIAKGITVPLIMVTGFGDVPTAVRSLKKGAVDFIEKPYNDQGMLDLILRAIEQDFQRRSDYELQKSAHDRLGRLTPREREVMELVAAGKSNKAVANDLDISPKTVEVHRAKVMRKMKVQSVAELVMIVGRYVELPPVFGDEHIGGRPFA